MLLQLYEYLLHNIRLFLLLYQRKNLLFKDTMLYNPVVRPVGFTIFWRVTDGIFTYRKDTVDEQDLYRSQTNKFDLVFLKLKTGNPVIYRDFRRFQAFRLLGARWDSNPRHSEPQALMPILSESLCTAQKYDSLKTAFAAILRLSLFLD